MLRSGWGWGTRYASVQGVGPARVVSGAVLALLLASAPAGAQEDGGLGFVGGLGYEGGGPGSTMVASLDAGGWGDDRQITGAGIQENPVHFGEGLPLVAFLGARYRFPWPVSIEVVGSNGRRGHVEGYNSAEGDKLVARYGSLLLSATGGIHLGPIRLAAGPIMNASSWEITRGGRESSRSVVLWGTEVAADGSIRLADVLLSLRAGIRRFPVADLRRDLSLPIEMEYQSFYVGVTVLTTGY